MPMLACLRRLGVPWSVRVLWWAVKYTAVAGGAGCAMGRTGCEKGTAEGVGLAGGRSGMV